MSFLSNFRKTFFVYAISLFLVAGAFLLPQVASVEVGILTVGAFEIVTLEV